MVYCRFGDGDVYLCHSGDHYVCCACRLNPTSKGEESGRYGDVLMDSPEEALRHLEIHETCGARVPNHAFDRLKREIGED